MKITGDKYATMRSGMRAVIEHLVGPAAAQPALPGRGGTRLALLPPGGPPSPGRPAPD
jgi:hypothetical protein